jgi:hypothetical protein
MIPQSRVHFIITLFERPQITKFLARDYLGQIIADSFNEELRKGKRKFKNLNELHQNYHFD